MVKSNIKYQETQVISMWNWETMRSRMKQFAPKYLKHFSMEAEMASEASVKSDIKQRKEIVKTVTH